jgi:hypothetical protein
MRSKKKKKSTHYKLGSNDEIRNNKTFIKNQGKNKKKYIE